MSTIALPTLSPIADDDRRSTRWSMTVSTGLHLLLLLFLVLGPHRTGEAPVLTEITLLEPGDIGAAAPAASAAAARQTRDGALAEAASDVQFRRETKLADRDPLPQSEAVSGDQIEARLASLQRRETIAASVPVASPMSGWGSVPATVPGNGNGGAAVIALARGGGGTGSAPLALTRGPGGASSAALTAATLAERHSAPPAAPAPAGEAVARRTLAGVSLAGPIADRAILSHPAPGYPEWAKRDAVEGSVTLYFIVRPDGTVKENVLVQKTAGFEDFDENARNALRSWRFAALPAGRAGEQWGTITFHFRLRDGG
jgi:TonB family protein